MSSLATTTPQKSAQNEDGSATDQRLRDFEDKLRKLFPKKGYIISLRDPQLDYYGTENRYHEILKTNKTWVEGAKDGLLIVNHEIDTQSYIHLFDPAGDAQEDGVFRGIGFIGEAGKLFKEYEDVVGWHDDEECPECAAFVYTKHISTKKRKMKANETDARKKARGESKMKLNDDSSQKKGKPKRIVGSKNPTYTDEVFQNFLKDRKRRKNLLRSGLQNLKAKWKAKLKDDSQNKKWKREYFFNYDGEHQPNKEPRIDFLYGLGRFFCGFEAFDEFCESVGCHMLNPRDILNYDEDDPEADYYPQIDWENMENGYVEEIKYAKETILNDILDHLSEGKSVAIGNWSSDYEIPLTIHDFNVGTMGAQEIYKRLSTYEKKCESMQIVPCTAEPFLGCHIICDENGMYGQKLNRMASYFLKNQVYGGKLYGNVLLTRHVD